MSATLEQIQKIVHQWKHVFADAVTTKTGIALPKPAEDLSYAEILSHGKGKISMMDLSEIAQSAQAQCGAFSREQSNYLKSDARDGAGYMARQLLFSWDDAAFKSQAENGPVIATLDLPGAPVMGMILHYGDIDLGEPDIDEPIGFQDGPLCFIEAYYPEKKPAVQKLSDTFAPMMIGGFSLKAVKSIGDIPALAARAQELGVKF